MSDDKTEAPATEQSKTDAPKDALTPPPPPADAPPLPSSPRLGPGSLIASAIQQDTQLIVNGHKLANLLVNIAIGVTSSVLDGQQPLTDDVHKAVRALITQTRRAEEIVIRANARLSQVRQGK